MNEIAKKMRGSIRTGQSNGNCGPAAPTTLNSWGAGCPPGMCTSADLAAGLGRQFAGEKYPCRELPYWLNATADANGVATIAVNSIITICPTRVIAFNSLEEDDAVLSEFTIGNQNQMVGDPIPIKFLRENSYQIIPFVTDCIKAGLPFSLTFTGNTAAAIVYVGLIGPAIG